MGWDSQPAVAIFDPWQTNPLTTNVPHHIETLQNKSINWLLYDGEHWSIMD